jgi:hypothetical protein
MHAMKLAPALMFAGAILALGGAAASAAPARGHVNGQAHAAIHRAPAHGAVHEAASCGQYLYRHDGKCVDARDRAPGEWSDSMRARPAW